MREEVAALEGMLEPEHCSQGPELLRALPVLLVTVVDLDNPVVVAVACESLHPVRRNFILEINL